MDRQNRAAAPFYQRIPGLFAVRQRFSADSPAAVLRVGPAGRSIRQSP
jgi:hypothetical protein